LAWRNEPLRDRLEAVPGLSRGLVLVAAGVSALDVVYVAASLLDGLARLLVFLLVYRVVMRRALRDLRDVAFLAFFMLVAAAPLTFGVGFLFVFLVFLVLGTWMLMLYHVATESERVGERSEDAVGALGRDLLGLAVGASAATLVLTAALFFLIPRVGQAALTLRSHQPRMLTGFSDRVELGAFGDIETDATVVMRVRLLGPGVVAPEQLPGLRWRGLALDRYAAGAWTSSRRARGTSSSPRCRHACGAWHWRSPRTRARPARRPARWPRTWRAATATRWRSGARRPSIPWTSSSSSSAPATANTSPPRSRSCSGPSTFRRGW